MTHHSWIIIIGILLIVTLAVFAVVFWKSPGSDVPPDAPGPFWGEYTSDPFHFSLFYPPDWEFSSLTNGFEQKFNAFLRVGDTTPPLTHHHNVTNISVFPNGIGSEGLFGERKPVDFATSFALTTSSHVFVLSDGTPFAAFLKPVRLPSGWGDAGFVWIRARIRDLATRCFEGTQELPEERCDPLTEGHRIEWNGTIDSSEWDSLIQAVNKIQLGLR